MRMDRSLVTTFLLVMSVHAGLILWVLGRSSSQPLLVPAPPLVVRTISLQPPQSVIQTVVQVAPAPKKTVVEQPVSTKTEAKKPKTVAQPKPAKAEVKKQVIEVTKAKEVAKPKPNPSTTTNKPAPKKVAAAQAMSDDPLLATARQALQSLKQPTTVEPAKAFAAASAAPQTVYLPYEQTLGQRLHQLVRLPEYGEVSIQLTLRRDGTVVKVEVLSAESERNRDHIQQQLPNLRFPTFGKQYTGEETHIFRLVIKNE